MNASMNCFLKPFSTDYSILKPAMFHLIVFIQALLPHFFNFFFLVACSSHSLLLTMRSNLNYSWVGGCRGELRRLVL